MVELDLLLQTAVLRHIQVCDSALPGIGIQGARGVLLARCAILCLVLVIVLAGPSLPGVAAETVYLRVAGPPPIRFALPPTPPPTDSAIVLPPLSPLEPAASDAVSATNTAGTNVTAAHSILPEASLTNTPSASTKPEDNFNPDLAQGLLGGGPIQLQLVVSNGFPSSVGPGGGFYDAMPLAPQLFMKYFTPGALTNNTGLSIFTPVQFIPPQPIALPSSSATFQTTLPGKP